MEDKPETFHNSWDNEMQPITKGIQILCDHASILLDHLMDCNGKLLFICALIGHA